MSQITKHHKTIKLAVCLLLIFVSIGSFVGFYAEDCIGYRSVETTYETTTATEIGSSNTIIKQDFLASANVLNSLKLQPTDVDASASDYLIVKILDDKELELYQTHIVISDLHAGQWYTLNVGIDSLNKGDTYSIVFSLNNNSCVEFSKFSTVFAESYLLTGILAKTLINLFFLLILLSLLCYAVYNIDTLFANYKHTEKKQGALWSLFLSFVFILWFNPLLRDRIIVSEFQRSIGDGILSDWDVSKVISNYTNWFIVFALSLIIFYLLMNYVKNKPYTTEQVKAFEYLDILLSISLVQLIYVGLRYYLLQPVGLREFSYSVYFIYLLMTVIAGYITFRLDEKVSFDSFLKAVFSLFGISIPLALSIFPHWGDGQGLFAINLALLAVLMVYCTMRKRLLVQYNDFVVIVCCAIPLITSVYYEAINVFNQHGIFISQPKIIYVLLILLLMFFCKFFSKRHYTLINWKTVVYPVLIIGVVFLSVQLPLVQQMGIDIFESANYSVLISDFLNFGKLPIVEHYGGHMLSGVVTGILYGWINQDFLGAILSPYSVYITPVLTLLFYYFTKKITDIDSAFFITLCIPFLPYWSYYGFGMIVCFAAIKYINNPTYKTAFLFWLLFAIAALYRLDLGAAFGIGTVIVLVFYFVFNKEYKQLRYFFISLLIVVAIVMILWVILCLASGINPIERLIEFLLISASNQNWAYGSLGNSADLGYFVFYLLIPCCIVAALCYLFMRCVRVSDTLQTESLLLVLMLGMVYLCNFSRGLVRHSFLEMALVIMAFTAFSFIPAFFVHLFSNRKIFLPLFVGITIIVGMLGHNTNYMYSSSIIDSSFMDKTKMISSSWNEKYWYENREQSIWQIYKSQKKVVDRVEWPEAIKSSISLKQDVISKLLQPNETYLDFVNQTFLYSAINRENPSYVAQSPGHLSDETTQDLFVKNLKQKNESIPLALLPSDITAYFGVGLDGIANNIRYYKVAEYIYQHYRPLCLVDDISIWCVFEKYDDYKERLFSYNEKPLELYNEKLKSLPTNSCEVSVYNNNGLKSLILNTTGIDPHIIDLQKGLSYEFRSDAILTFTIEYSSNQAGVLQMFYTTNENEGFSQEKSISKACNEGFGTVDFTIETTKFTRLRLDIPENSIVKIESIKISEGYPAPEVITWGYDGPTSHYELNGMQINNYFGGLHNYNMYYLPIIWGERDKQEANNNAVMSTVSNNGSVYHIDSMQQIERDNGNYLLMQISFPGIDNYNYAKIDDEYCSATLKMGTLIDNNFDEKYCFRFNVLEGTHQYLIRVSSDYYWYSDNIDSIKLEANAEINNVKMSILAGD